MYYVFPASGIFNGLKCRVLEPLRLKKTGLSVQNCTERFVRVIVGNYKNCKKNILTNSDQKHKNRSVRILIVNSS